jgi:hypothetical protein
MIICPWCGTNYLVFQSNCKNCGGPLQAVEVTAGSSVSTENIPTPPQAPRSISKSYVWRLLSTDGWAIAAFVFGLLGGIFSLVGAGLTIGIITAFVGIPFLLLGLVFLGIGGGILNWRYNETQKVVNVLRVGEATTGKIVEIQENYSVRINGRYLWVIQYQFQVNGQNYEGKVSTLNPVGEKLQIGKAVCILYLQTTPQSNSIYPHP